MERPFPKAAAIALVLAALALAGVGTAAWVSMRRRSDAQLCAANLQVLYLAVRSGELLDSPRWDAAGLGRAFVASQDRWPGAQKRDYDPCCPVKGTRDDVDYRGPARPLRQLGVRDPLFADRPGNHGPGRGGNVCLKNGEILDCAERDPFWLRAAETTAD